jgi:hypothetical protein
MSFNAILLLFFCLFLSFSSSDSVGYVIQVCIKPIAYMYVCVLCVLNPLLIC